jgi:hypothetical protein
MRIAVQILINLIAALTPAPIQIQVVRNPTSFHKGKTKKSKKVQVALLQMMTMTNLWLQFLSLD